MSLTAPQHAVAHHEGGHAIVGAVAGSGKTHTMVARCIHLLEKGVDPRRMLVLMFNKSAQEDFTRRLGIACTKAGLPTVEVQTFHGFGLRLSSRLCQAGLLPEATLEADLSVLRRGAREILQAVNAEKADDEQLDLTYEVVNEFLEALDGLKGDLYPCEDGRGDLSALSTDQRFLRGFALFEEARQANGMRTFADLIYDPVMAALNNPAVAQFIGGRYEHVIVDEFQDVNEAQMTLIRLIAGTRATVMAVGDEDQCIYGWRGARPDYMTSLFTSEFPGAVRYTLPHTFRFGHALSLMANFVISNNQNRTDKICLSGTDRQTLIDVRVPGRDPGSEVVTCIREWIGQGRSYGEVAILVREYAHSPASEVALLQAGIPYRIVGAAPFFERAEALGLRAYLQLAAGGFAAIDDRQRRVQLVMALLQTPTLYLRKTVIEQIAEEVADSPNDLLQIAERVFNSDRRAKDYTRTRRLEAVDRWRWVMGYGTQKSAALLLSDLITRLNLYREIEKNIPDRRVADEKVRMIGQIVKLAKTQPLNAPEFATFLDQLANDYGASDANGEDRILLTSCHRAKGLQWPMVILPELTDGQFPAIKDGSTDDDIEDERRLFYVATTRAMEKLVMIAPLDRAFVAAAHRGNAAAPGSPVASRFLYEANVLVALEELATERNIECDARSAALLHRYREAIAA